MNKQLRFQGLLGLFCVCIFSSLLPAKEIPTDGATNAPPVEKGHIAGGAEDKAPEGVKKKAGEADDKSIEEVPHDNDDAKVAKAVAVPSDPVQVFGWKEDVAVGDLKDLMIAKLDTGALTSSIHAIEEEVFERDGEKWVRFITSETRGKKRKRYQLEAPLVRTVLIKEPGGGSKRRRVVRLTFRIGQRRLRADFTLNNRENMVCPVLIGRSTIKVLGWVDPSRTHLADKKVMR